MSKQKEKCQKKKVKRGACTCVDTKTEQNASFMLFFLT